MTGRGSARECFDDRPNPQPLCTHTSYTTRCKGIPIYSTRTKIIKIWSLLSVAKPLGDRQRTVSAHFFSTANGNVEEISTTLSLRLVGFGGREGPETRTFISLTG